MEMDKQKLYEEFLKLNQEVDVMEKMIQAKYDRMEKILPLIDIKLIETHKTSRFEIMEIADCIY